MKTVRRPRKSLSTNNIKSMEEELTLVLMPKSKWVPDNQTHNCFNCNKSFIPFVRPKHHCRRCGNIFCNMCSQNFLSGGEIGLPDTKKKVRFCDYCFQGYQNFLKLKMKSTKDNSTNANETLSQIQNYLLKDKEDLNSSNIKHRVFFTETTNIPFLHEKHQEIVSKNNEELITFIFKKYKIYDKWFKKLFDLIEKSVRNILPSTINRADVMDINKYVKIKKIPYKDETLTKYMNGVVCRKNIIDKKMKNRFPAPRIFIATQIELVGNSDLAVFENLIQNEKKQIRKVIDKIMKLRPDVILVEKSINRIALEHFKEKEIIIIVKIKHHLLKRIARVTKATILKDLNMLEKLSEDKILGSCENFEIKKFFIDDYKMSNPPTNQSPSFFKEFDLRKGTIEGDGTTKKEDSSDDPNYLFIEVMNQFLGSTLIISGPKEEELMIVKDCLKLSLKLMRHFILEKEVVMNEIILINQINFEKYRNQQLLKKSESFGSMVDENLLEEFRNYYRREGDFSRYLFNKIGMEGACFKRFINYTKVCYAKSSWENSNEICANEEAVKYYYQLFGDKKKKNEKSTVEFLEICELPSSVKIEYYSEEDLALGQYLILRVNNLNSRCENCKRPRYQHIVFYYFNKVFVKISCELTGMSHVQSFNIEEQMLRQSTELGVKDNHFEMVKDSVTPKASYTKEMNSPPQKSFAYTKQNTRKLTSNATFKAEIKTYIECNACRSILTKETLLTPNYLEYSFTRYLLHFFLNNETKEDGKDNEERISEGEDSNKCRHRMRNRVFDYNGVLIKMSSGLGKVYRLDKIKDIVSDPENKTNLELLKSNLLLLKREDLKAKIKIFSTELIRILENSSSSVKGNEPIDTKKSFASHPTLPQSQSHLEDWKNPIEFQATNSSSNADFDMDENEEDDNEYYQLFENPHINFNAIETSMEMLGRSDCFDESRGMEDLHKIDPVESSNELNAEEIKNLVLAINDKSVRDRLNVFKKMKLEFANSTHYSENVNKARGNIVSFLQKIVGGISALTYNFLNHLSKTTFRSYLNIEFLRFKYMRKICEMLTILHFLTHVKDKKKKPIKGQNPMHGSKKIIETMKNSMQIPNPQINEEEDDDASHTEGMKIVNIQEENDNSQGEEKEEENNDSPDNYSKMLEQESLDLTYTPLFQKLYNELNRGRVFVDNKEGKPFREFQKFKIIPVNDDEPLSLVAHALNSCQYMKEVYVKSEFPEIEKKLANKQEKDWRNNCEIYNFFENILDETEIIEKNATFSLKSYIKINSKTPLHSNDPQNLETNSTEFEESINIKNFKTKFYCEKVKVIVYYPAFFEALRMASGIPLFDFIQSLALNNQWKENSGGKSKAKFIKSYDELYIIKQLQKNEFFMIQSYAKNFFSYLWKILNGEAESIMTKIFGLYEVSVNNMTYYYMVMENLFYGLKSENLQIFDLKGSETNRFVKKVKSGQTLLDTNFKIERNNEPLAILDKDFNFFKNASENDSNFLSEHNLIDYSLLLIIDEKNVKIRLGIIDFLRIYTWDKQLEHMGKIVINAGAVPTITNPFDYKERFINALKKYFMESKIN